MDGRGLMRVDQERFLDRVDNQGCVGLLGEYRVSGDVIFIEVNDEILYLREDQALRLLAFLKRVLRHES